LPRQRRDSAHTEEMVYYFKPNFTISFFLKKVYSGKLLQAQHRWAVFQVEATLRTISHIRHK
jgi:hypothetical protein